MKRISNYMDRDVHSRPRIGPYGWVSKSLEFGEEMLVLLYGAHMIGHGVGNTLIGPENNGLAVFDSDGKVLRENIAREASGYFGPSDKQLKMFSIMENMTPDQITAWCKHDFDINKLKYHPSCPVCARNLYLQIEVTHDVPFTVSESGQWDWEVSNMEGAVIQGCHMMYCPGCGAEWIDSEMNNVPVLTKVVEDEKEVVK